MLSSKPFYTSEIRHPPKTPPTTPVLVPEVVILNPSSSVNKCASDTVKTTTRIQTSSNQLADNQGNYDDDSLPDGSFFRRCPLQQTVFSSTLQPIKQPAEPVQLSKQLVQPLQPTKQPVPPSIQHVKEPIHNIVQPKIQPLPPVQASVLPKIHIHEPTITIQAEHSNAPSVQAVPVEHGCTGRPRSREGVKVGTLRPASAPNSVPSIAARAAEYLGSFAVAGAEQSVRAEYVRTQLTQLRGCTRSKPVLLVVSLAGVKVCSPDGKVVHMAHALRRISYATCDPESALFSFLAREPKGHFSLQYCHSFRARTPEQAEQLNSIVGNAFRMAYAAQLTRQPSPFNELITKDSSEDIISINNNNINNNANNQQLSSPAKQQRHTWSKTMAGRAAAAAAAADVKLSPAKPGTLPGLRSCSPRLQVPTSPESDDSNSPTELNCARRVGEKPPLVKRMGAVGLVTPPAAPPPPVIGTSEENKQSLETTANLLEVQDKRSSQASPADDATFRAKRSSQTSSGSSSASGPLTSRGPSPPPLPERSDSLVGKAEDEILQNAPWFQAGIPREIALEVLGQEPVGAFMVRESTTKPGCYALSLRVPREFQPTGIAHYLIMRTARGYKIKGFTKEFCTLISLITHHSVMPELLPCPLTLTRQHNPSFTAGDQEGGDTSRDFADMDSDPDYSTLADFRKMMADLNV